MKFSEIKKEEWPALKPYLDTCLLPVTGLGGGESPVEAAEQLEKLRDVLDLLERPYRGRTVTYPAWHFVPESETAVEQLADIVTKIRATGFKFVVIVTISEPIAGSDATGADLIITPNNTDQIAELISNLWK